MSIATQISRLQGAKADLKSKINELSGVPGGKISSELIDDYADLLATIKCDDRFEIGATTVRYDASHTENISSNDHIKILGSDDNEYTLAEWNAMFVDAGYDKNNMTISPKGLAFHLYNTNEAYLFDRFTGSTYNPVGDSAGAVGKLQHSIYNCLWPSSSNASGTDITTGKAWSVTVDGDELILYEANTKQTWRMSKNAGNVYSRRAVNIEERTHALWAYNEWLRHRMAIKTLLETTEPDGTIIQVDILNDGGGQASVGEDMYFWIDGTYTDILAKYNKNNRHGENSTLTSQAVVDAIYARQIANGINMNDTGVNSASKPILAPGSKGAEAIAVDGYWYIITPYISQPSVTTATATNNMADSPVAYWLKYKGYSGPSDSLLFAIYSNYTIATAMVSYLNNREGWGVPIIPNNDYTWSISRYSGYFFWVVYLGLGSLTYSNPFYRYFTVGASAL